MTQDSSANHLERISRLLAIGAVMDRKQVDQSTILAVAGCEPKEIADLLGTSRNNVSVSLSNLRKSGPIKLPKSPKQ